MDTKEVYSFLNEIVVIVIFKIVIITFTVVGTFYLINKYLNTKKSTIFVVTKN